MAIIGSPRHGQPTSFGLSILGIIQDNGTNSPLSSKNAFFCHAAFLSRFSHSALQAPYYALSLPRRRTAWPYFWSLVMSWSPCRTTSWYCLFLSSGRLVSMTPLPETRSMVQGMRPAAMNLARSLFKKRISSLATEPCLLSQPKEYFRETKLDTYLSRKSTVTPKSLAILSRPTTR
jgi:hypothetical protein